MNCNTRNYPNMTTGNGLHGSMGRISANNCGCGPSEPATARNVRHDSMGRMPIAMAYVPWEHFSHTYELEQAIEIGTIFPELNKPFTGRGGNCL